MASPTKASAVLVASVLMLTVFTFASKPRLSIDRFDASGKPSPTFVEGEIPTFHYTLSQPETTGIVIKVRRQTDGVTIWRDYISGAYISEGRTGLNSDLPALEAEREQIMLPGLDAGNYTAEICIKGRLETSLNFSVSGRTDYVNHSPAPRRVTQTSGIVVKHIATSKSTSTRNFIDAAINRLDAFVGLTPEQKSATTKIYLEEYPRMEAIAPGEEGLPQQFAIREEINNRIRPWLTIEQQKLLDDAPASPTGSWLVARLDDQLNLTPGQKVAAEKIFADQRLALKKFPSSGQSAANEMDIRQKARLKIRTLLTPAQQTIYDGIPQRFGGGANFITQNS
jgi:hypothetical protein